MKILYAIQATGNGHISRAAEILPYLTQDHQVDVFLSGDNHALNLDYPVAYTSKGLSLRMKECGELDTFGTLKCFNPIRLRRDIKSLPVEKYDLVINDFEYIAARACKAKNVPSIHVGHQASFLSSLTPRHEPKSKIGEYIFKHYAPSTHSIGLHFEKYDKDIMFPIIRQDVRYAKPSEQGHITIYLPGCALSCFDNIVNALPSVEFHIFSPSVEKNYERGNVKYCKPSLSHFSSSMIHSIGVITGGGFETPAEALFLKKRLISIPIDRHYEQQCNGAALKKLGVVMRNNFNELTPEFLHSWLSSPVTTQKIESTSIPTLIEKVMSYQPTTMSNNPLAAVGF